MENTNYNNAQPATNDTYKEHIEWASKHVFGHQGFSTKCIHAGQPPEPVHGSVNVPIHMSSTFAQTEPNKPFGEFDYTRCGNPTSDALNKCLAKLAYAKYAWTFASGCGGTSSLFGLWSTGDHILVCDDVYGGTNRLVNQMLVKRYGLVVEMIDMTNLELVKEKVKENTKMVWIETPTNPTLKLIDIEAVTKIVKSINKDSVVVVDNTFASPYNQSPILLGADIAFNSLSKYIAGHSDVIAGSIATNNKDLYDRIFFNAKNIGANISPFDSYLVLRGAKTLAIRMKQASISSLALAKFLDTHPQVDKVNHPGLESHPQHELAKKQMRGFSGMITFWIKGGEKAALSFFKKVSVFTLAESLGGVESLCEYPCTMTHASVPEDQRIALGIDDRLIRLSVGVEDTLDLIQDLDQALQA